jgi:hypothetical protein
MKISCNRILKYGYSRLSGYQQAGYGSWYDGRIYKNRF